MLLIIGYLAWQMTSAATDSAVPAAASTLELLPAPSEPTPAEPAEEPSPESAEREHPGAHSERTRTVDTDGGALLGG